MRTTPLPPLAVTLSFVDCINRGDLDRLAELMTDDHWVAEARDGKLAAWRIVADTQERRAELGLTD